MSNGQIKISPSKMSVAEECQLRFNLKYVQRVKIFQYSNPAAAIGTAFHKVAELMYVRKNFDLEVLLSYMDEAWKNALAKNKLRQGDVTTEAVQKHMEKLKKMIINFHAYLVKNDLIGVQAAATEQNFQIAWTPEGKGWNRPPIIVNGYIDRIMVHKGKAWVTDYKTTSDIPEQPSVDKNMQLTIYAAAYRYLAKKKLNGEWPKKENYVELFFPAPSKAYPLMSERTKEHFVDMKERLLLTADVEIHGRKKASPSENNCKYCEFKFTRFCPATFPGAKQ